MTSPAGQRRWLWVFASAAVFSVIGAAWVGTAIRNDLQYEPPGSNHYGEYRLVHDSAPWVGGMAGLLFGVALSMILLRIRSVRWSARRSRAR